MTHNNFGLVVDLSHFPTTYETSRFVIRTLRPYISHFHFGNAVVKPGCDGYGDKHPRFGYPNSANDVAEMLDFLRVLKEEGFLTRKIPMSCPPRSRSVRARTKALCWRTQSVC